MTTQEDYRRRRLAPEDIHPGDCVTHSGLTWGVLEVDRRECCALLYRRDLGERWVSMRDQIYSSRTRPEVAEVEVEPC